MKKQITLLNNFYNDLLGFTLLGLSVFTALILYSYSPHDPSLFFHSTAELPVENIGGAMGAYLASLCYFLFGSASFSLVALYIYAASLLLKRRAVYTELERIVAAILIPLSLSSIFALRELDAMICENSGGLIGLRLSVLATYYLDNIGAAVFFYAVLLASAIIIIRFNYMKQIKKINAVIMVIGRQCRRKRIDKKIMYVSRMCCLFFAKIMIWLFKQIKNTLNGSIFDSIKLFDPPKLDDFKTSLAEKRGSIRSSYQTTQVSIPSVAPKEDDTQEVIFESEDEDIMQQHDISDYTVPNQTFFDYQDDAYSGDADSKQRAITLEEKLERFGVKGKVVDIKYGPVVTLYEYQPESHVKLSKIVALEDDLSLALQAVSIRILAPIPGRSVVGFEVANKTRADVLFSNVIHSSSYQETRAALPLVLGADTCGEYIVEDLSRMPHLLVAGSTGSGKSVALNAMLMSLLCKHSPQTLRMILIDPKRLEFSSYADIGHLLFPIVTDPKQAIMSLKWAIKEMERRYEEMATCGVRNIFEFHKLNPENKREFPFIVVVIDELADLMITVAKDIEEHITRLAQMARAAGIHLIVATQRPSVDVITGLIKVNFPSRISFRVTSKIDSRTIIDAMGAEKLLGRGDMLFLNGVSSMIERIHGAYVTDIEIGKVTRYIRTSWPAVYEDIQEFEPIDDAFSMSPEDGQLLEQVHEYLQEVDEVSISLIQRKFRVGYNKSARIIELLEAQGYVMPAQGGKRRKVIR